MSPFIRENSDKPPRLLAKTFFRELRENGYSDEQILWFSSEMMQCLSRELDSKPSEEH